MPTFGVMNLLPIPALDGGKLVLNVIEGIRKKPLDPEKEGYLTIAGAIFLFALMLLVTWNDIMKYLIRQESVSTMVEHSSYVIKKGGNHESITKGFNEKSDRAI